MMQCRHCNQTLENIFLDLGLAPFSNAYLSSEDLKKPEPKLPLKLYVCHHCWLVQTQDFAKPDELFQSDYAYFSSVSSSWLEHARSYVAMITKRLELNKDSFVIEVASNDGYLLKNFVKGGIPCLGIEPTSGTANAARAFGIEVREEFFSEKTALTLPYADLIIGNNVYAHVPDINDFTKALKIALKPTGTITLEFPHVVELIKHNQFDTVYHEHFSYLSLNTVYRIFKSAGLAIYDVEKINTHGGSLRIYGCHENAGISIKESVDEILKQEKISGLLKLETYLEFQSSADRVRDNFIAFLHNEKKKKRKVVGYGAAAKGNTLLNYADVKTDLIEYICDAAPSKQGKFMPGSNIPILPPDVLKNNKPDTIIIFPWNIADEIKKQLSFVRTWGATFATAVPELKIEEA